MLYYFNPGHETAVLVKSIYYTAPSNMLAMQRDLSFLPAWYALPHSTIWVEQEDDSHLNWLKQQLNLHIQTTTTEKLQQHDREEVCVWGISPHICHLLQEENKLQELNLVLPQWQDAYYGLNSREVATACLKQLVGNGERFPKSIIPTYYTTLEEIDEAVKASDIQLLAKSPYSSAGRGLLRLPNEGITRTEKQILHGMLKKQGKISLEPLLNKQIDFAMEFMSDGKGEIQFVGYSLFKTSDKGAYLGNTLQAQERILELLASKIDATLLEEVKLELTNQLSVIYGSLYTGCIGVDMLIYEEDGAFKLQPCIEINMRYNMGYLAIRLFEEHIVKESTGEFLISFQAQAGDTYLKHIALQEAHPAQFENKRLVNGYLPLCPVTEQSKYMAYVLID